jgi:hypothetical protein
MTAPLGGAEAGDPGAPTINARKRRRRTPWEVTELEIRERPPSTEKISTAGTLAPAGGGGFDPHPRSKRCIVNLHRYDSQKVIILMGPILPALSFVMADDP